MKIVIIGAGRVGSTLAENLASEANDITLIDTEEELLQGFLAIANERMAEAISQLGQTYEFQNNPTPEAYFTDAYLPEGGFKLN